MVLLREDRQSEIGPRHQLKHTDKRHCFRKRINPWTSHSSSTFVCSWMCQCFNAKCQIANRLPGPQSQLRWWCEDQCRRTTSCSSGNRSICSVQVEFLFVVAIWTSRATAARGQLPLAISKKHHTLFVKVSSFLTTEARSH